MKNKVFSFLKEVKRIPPVKKGLILLILGALIFYYFCFPTTLFHEPTSTVIESTEGILLGAKIAEDEQWRFPEIDKVPKKFAQSITQLEDAYFYYHVGFNPISIAKAFYLNTKQKQIIRGGSTISQQVIRLSRKNKSRTYFEKGIEFILATRLELKYSKKKILALYSSHAPFGGNVVGLEAASWRYFGKSPNALSWAESATLAVLPNAPGLIFPGKRERQLVKKRNFLLKKLHHKGIIDATTYQLSLLEKVPPKPFPIPQTAPHLLEKIVKEHKGKRIKTTLQLNVQQTINRIVKRHYATLSKNEIYNIAILVMDVPTRKIQAYIGNSPTHKNYQKDVDIIEKPRSTGSILKPILFMAALDDGLLLPKTLVADIPTSIASYTPQNFNRTFEGAIPLDEALTKSLNIPFVRLLQRYGLEKFHYNLQQLKLRDIRFSADHYGLPLILGGAESNLWDICKTYASLASTVTNYTLSQGKYFENEFIEPSYLANFEPDLGALSNEKTMFDAGSIFQTFEVLKKGTRPIGYKNWEQFSSNNQIAWKTGTSFGFKDAWSVGITPDKIVGVWVGNADGEGRKGLVGINVAAPILFDIFEAIPTDKEWFSTPFDELEKITLCKKSGYRAGMHCKDEVIEQLVPYSGLQTTGCPYHLSIFVNEEETHQINSTCASVSDLRSKNWFVLPPIQEFYYKNKNPSYQALPPFKDICVGSNKAIMDFIYPKLGVDLYLSKNFNEKDNPFVFKIAHPTPEIPVFWHIDKQFIGLTQSVHEIEILVDPGVHILTAVDALGNEVKRKVVIKE